MIHADAIDVDSLRAKLEEVFPAASVARQRVRRLSTGIDAFDRVLEGGLCQGTVIAWSGRSGSGLLSLLRATVYHLLSQSYRVAIVDGAGMFCAADWVNLPNPSHLWFVRPPDVHQALGAAEILTRCGAFDLVAVDLSSCCVGQKLRSAHLRRAVKEGTTALVLLGEEVAAMGTVAIQINPAAIDLSSQERLLDVSLVRGGFPRKEEVILDVSNQLIACRLPSYPSLPDRRPGAKRPRREGFEMRTDRGRG